MEKQIFSQSQQNHKERYQDSGEQSKNSKNLNVLNKSQQTNQESSISYHQRMNRSKFNFNIQDHEDLNRVNQKCESLLEFDYSDLSKIPIQEIDKTNGLHQYELASPIQTVEELYQLQGYYISSKNNISNQKDILEQTGRDDNAHNLLLKNVNRNSIENRLFEENNTIYGDINTKIPQRISFFDGLSNNNCNTLGIEKHIQLYEADRNQSKRDRQNSGELTTRNDMSKKGEGKKTIKGSFKLITFILPRLRKFFETKTYQGRTKFLNQELRQLINDTCDYEKKTINTSNIFTSIVLYLFKCVERFCILLRLNKIPLFDPENFIKLIINAIIVAYNCFFLFIISVEVCFSAHFPDQQKMFHSVAMAAWITEMLLQMNTATYHHNTFTKDRKIILKIYCKEYIFFEILPLLFEGRTSDSIPINILLHLPLLLKIKGIMIIMKKIEFYALQMLEKHYILFLFKLCTKVIILGHIIACTRNIVSSFEAHVLGIENTWVLEFQNSSWHILYLECLYWSFAIMMHNLSEKPRNDIELVYSCLIMLITTIIFGYMLNSIGTILADISKSQEEYKKDLNILNSYMKRKHIDLQVLKVKDNHFKFNIFQQIRSLRRRVNSNLLKYYHQQTRDKIIQEKETISKLSEYIQHELIYSSNHKILKQFPLFCQLFSNETLVQLYNIMEEVIYAPNQMIFSQQSSHEDSIFLIQSGQDGEYFGLFNFITGKDKTMNAQSNKFSQIVKINRNNFINIIKDNKADYEKFMELKDRIIFDKNYKVVKELNCFGCQSQDHMIESCNKIFFDKQNVYIFHNYNYSPFQERHLNFNRKKKSFQTFLQFSKVQETCTKYAKENNLIDSSHDLSYDSNGIANKTESSLSNDDDDDEEQSQTPKNTSKDLLSSVQEEKLKSIKRKKYSLSALKSFDITSIQSENLDDGRKAEEFSNYNNLSKALTKQTEKEFATEYIGDDEVNNFFRQRTKSHHNYTGNLKKNSLYKINSDQDVIIPSNSIANGVESIKRDYNSPSILDSFGEKGKSQTNFAKERSPQSPPTSLFYDIVPPMPSRKSILINNDKEDILNNQILHNKSSLGIANNSHLKPRHSIHFMNSQFIRKLYNQQNQQAQEDLQLDDYFEWKFEKIQEYQNYFIFYNYPNVIKRLNGNMYNRQNKRKRTLRTKTKLKGTTIIRHPKQSGQQFESKINSHQQSNTSNN